MERVRKEELARRLESRVECAHGGEQGLQTLIYGWLKWRKYGEKYRHAVHARDYLYAVEIAELSSYAGCDLS
jgi:hypothetical protein